MTDKTYLSEWKRYYEDVGLPADMYGKYLKYCGELISSSMPPILEFNHLAHLLGRDPGYLASAVNHAESHYRTFFIKKRSGGKRKISAPYPALLGCQRWIYDNILRSIDVHNCAHGFVARKSIITNAKVHIGAKEMLKVDIEDFFPSISLNRIIHVFIKAGYANNVSVYLAKLCCLDGGLPQGSPASPFLSNIICKRLDHRLFELSKKWYLKYSRYADDMTFSGGKISKKYCTIVEEIIEDEGFVVKKEKTNIIKSNRKIVTGISVSGDTVSLPKDYKNKIRQEVYFISKYGIISHTAKRKIKNPFYIDRIFGMLNFWHYVEPEAKFPVLMIPKMKKILCEYGAADIFSDM